jgi:hypothetical protein
MVVVRLISTKKKRRFSRPESTVASFQSCRHVLLLPSPERLFLSSAASPLHGAPSPPVPSLPTLPFPHLVSSLVIKPLLLLLTMLLYPSLSRCFRLYNSLLYRLFRLEVGSRTTMPIFNPFHSPLRLLLVNLVVPHT